MFDNILRHVESSALKLGISYSSFILEILKDQRASLLLYTDVFTGPPTEIRLNPKLFRGLHRTDAPSRNGGDASTSIDASISAPTPVPPTAAPDLTFPFPMNSGLGAYPQAELLLL